MNYALSCCPLEELEPPCSGPLLARLIRRGKSGYTPEFSKKPGQAWRKIIVVRYCRCKIVRRTDRPERNGTAASNLVSLEKHSILGRENEETVFSPCRDPHGVRNPSPVSKGCTHQADPNFWATCGGQRELRPFRN